MYCVILIHRFLQWPLRKSSWLTIPQLQQTRSFHIDQALFHLMLTQGFLIISLVSVINICSFTFINVVASSLCFSFLLQMMSQMKGTLLCTNCMFHVKRVPKGLQVYILCLQAGFQYSFQSSYHFLIGNFVLQMYIINKLFRRL